MKNFSITLILLSSLISKLTFQTKVLYDYQKDGNTELSSYRIGFGSCFDKKQKRTDIFKDINQENLDLWIWLGDFAYVDKHVGVIMQYVYGQNYLIEDEETRRKKFATTYEDEYYSLLKKQTPVIGIWDDHDYGKNDGDATNPIKLNNKQVYLDFLDEPQDSPRRHRGDNTGIYEDYQIKLRKDFSVRIILLDVRFSKTKETLLGDDQWKWFENVLKNSNDQVYLLGSGVQFMMRDRLIGAERWPDKEYQRLLDLIKQYKKSGVFLLSGDVHHSQLLSPKCKLNGLGYELTEITSSGLTHTCDRNLAGLCSYALKGNTPGTYPISQVFAQHNYAIFEIQLDNQSSGNVHQNLELSIKGRDNQTFLQRSFNLINFQYQENFTSRFCEAERMRNMLHKFIHVWKMLINEQHILIGGLFFAIVLYCTISLSVAIRIAGFIFKMTQYFNKK